MAAIHRANHRHDGRQGDAHAATRGFWWSHAGWVFFRAPNGFRFRRLHAQVPDLAADGWLLWLERHHRTLNVAFAAAIGAAFGFEAMLWAVPLRVVAVWHTTWLVNSLAHAAPLKPRETSDEGSLVNVRWLGIISYGEGLHRNHHERPAAASFRRERADVDLGYGAVRLLCALGLAKVPA